MQEFEFHPIANVFPLIEGDEFEALVQDITEHGVLEPIWLYEDKILDGRNRYRAGQQAGVYIPIREYEGDKPVEFVISLNLKRRHLTPSQASMVAARIANLKDGQRQDLLQGSPIGEAAVTQQQAADLLNVGKRSVERAREVIEEGTPELIQAVERGSVSVSAAADVATLPMDQQAEIVARGEDEILASAKRIREERAAKKREENESIKASFVPVIPDGKYGTIVIDPPWDMEKIERDVAPNQVAFEYPTMSESELVDFGSIINQMADDNCHMFQWTTQKYLPMTLRLLEAWGFKYVLTMVWHKPGGFQPFGLPQYNCEFAVYARRGSPKFTDTKAFPTCFQAPRREHSRKPVEFYNLVHRVTDGPRIDVFSRELREGFAQYGNEADKFSEAA